MINIESLNMALVFKRDPSKTHQIADREFIVGFGYEPEGEQVLCLPTEYIPEIMMECRANPNVRQS